MSSPGAVATPGPAPAQGPRAVAPVDQAKRIARVVGAVVADQVGGENTEPVDWAWHGIVARGDAVELAGRPYSGKSTLSFLLAVASVADVPVELFGHVVAPLPADKVVIVVNVEQRRASIGRKLTEAAIILGLDPARVLRRVLILGREDEARFHGDARADTWKALRGERANVGLYVLDSRGRLLGGEANDEHEQAAAAAHIGALTTAGAIVLVISHVRKGGDPRAELELEDVAGHHQRGAAPDAVLLVSCRRAASGEPVQTRVRVAKRRDDGGEEHPEPMLFAIDRSGERPVLVTGDGASSNPAHRADDGVVELLAEHGAMTENAIRKALGIGPERLRKLLAGHRAAKRLKVRHEKIGGRERTLYELTADAALEAEGILAQRASTV